MCKPTQPYLNSLLYDQVLDKVYSSEQKKPTLMLEHLYIDKNMKEVPVKKINEIIDH